MALLNSYSDRNRVVSEGLSIRYAQRIETVSTARGTAVYYEASRYATKRYAYVGMTEEAAAACAAAKRSKYTRVCYKTYRIGDGIYTPGVVECSAEVSLRNDDGSWSVEISVSETDIRLTASQLTTADALATLFALENARDYDEGAEDVVSPQAA